MSAIDKPILEASFQAVTVDGVVPPASQKTGTIISSGTVVTGAGTSFKTRSELRVGDYVYAQDQVRKVTAIFSDTRFDIDRAFAPDIAAPVNFFTVRSLPNTSITIKNTGGGTADISTILADGQPLIATESVHYESKNGVSPIAYVVNGATLNIYNG